MLHCHPVAKVLKISCQGVAVLLFRCSEGYIVVRLCYKSLPGCYPGVARVFFFSVVRAALPSSCYGVID